MKKISICLIILLALSFSACGRYGGKYGPFKKFIDNMVTAQTNCIESIEKSGSPDDIVMAIDTYSEKLQSLAIEVGDLNKKYPDFNKWANEPPSEIQSYFAKMNLSNKKFQAIFLADEFRKYQLNDKVQKSVLNLVQEINSLKLFK